MNACPSCGTETETSVCPACGHETAPKPIPTVNELATAMARAVEVPAEVKRVINEAIVSNEPREYPSLAMSKALEQINAKLDALSTLLVTADAHARASEADRDNLLQRILAAPDAAELVKALQERLEYLESRVDAPPAVPDFAGIEGYCKDIVAKFMHQADERAAQAELRDLYHRQLDVADLATKLLAAWSNGAPGQIDAIAVTAAVAYAQQIMHEASKSWTPPAVPVVPVEAPTAG